MPEVTPAGRRIVRRRGDGPPMATRGGEWDLAKKLPTRPWMIYMKSEITRLFEANFHLHPTHFKMGNYIYVVTS